MFNRNLPTFDLVRDLVTYLNHRNISDEDLCRFLMLNTLHEFGASSALIARTNSDETFSMTKSHGPSGNTVDSAQHVKLDSQIPIAEALRSNQQIWLSIDHKLFVKYPRLKDTPQFASGRKLILWQLRKFNQTVGAMGFVSNLPVYQCEEIEKFFSLIGDLVAMRFHLNSLDLPPSIQREVQQSRLRDLTELERNILKLMAQDFSNKSIGDKLGMSELNVRTNSVAIYRKLDVHSRSEAIKTVLSC